jgi:hypothetical protein
MEQLLDYDEVTNPEKLETFGVTFGAEGSESAKPTKSGKRGRKDDTPNGATIFRAAITDGDFSGVCKADFQAYLTEYNKKMNAKSAKMDAVFNAGTKGAGKGGWKPRDKSGDTCNNCGKKGHWAPECKAPRAEVQGNHKPVGSAYFGKGGKGKGKGRKGKNNPKNPAVGAAPY